MPDARQVFGAGAGFGHKQGRVTGEAHDREDGQAQDQQGDDAIQDT
jgi:hypothetical protein